MKIVLKYGALAGASMAAIMWSGTAVAQDGAEAAQPTGGLQEIVVTAQKRAENLQKTPLAVSAMTAETLEARGISDVADISAAAPNLTTSITPSSTTNITVQIRGIGESDPVLTADSPVGIYVDGVVIGRTAGAVFDLVDLERVEVLRGPQGTLYGRNTTGGAVNFISAKPAKEFKGSQTFSYGNLDYMVSRTSIDTGEIGNSGLMFKLSYAHKQRDGYANDINQPDKRDPGAYNTDAFRIAARFDNGGPVRVDYAFDYNDTKSYAVPFQLAFVRPDIAAYFANSQALGGSPLEYSRDRIKNLNLDQGRLTDKVRGHTLTVEADLTDTLTLRSLTGLRKWKNTVGNTDLDGNDGLLGMTISPAYLAPKPDFQTTGVKEITLFSAQNRRSQKQFSQELNLIGKIGDNVDFVLGGFYFKEKVRENNPQQFSIIVPTPAPVPLGNGLSTDYAAIPLASNLAYRHSSESVAAFGQVTYRATDRLSLTGGMRYTEDRKHLDQTAGVAVRDLRETFRQFNWAASVDYKFTDDILGYVRVATGYKSGGFNPRSVGGSFKPEKITSYEAGLKTELLDRRLRLNLTAFHSIYKDMQVSQFTADSNGASSITVNAGKAKYTGVEAEILANPVDGLTLNASFGYTDRKFKSFWVYDPAEGRDVNAADEAHFNYSASTTANAGIQYDTEIANVGKLMARVDWTYRSRIYFHPLDRFNPFNQGMSDGPVGRFDARIALSDIDLGPTRATVALWGKNITNRDYLYSGIDFGALGFAGVVFAEPRTYGVDVKFDF